VFKGKKNGTEIYLSKFYKCSYVSPTYLLLGKLAMQLVATQLSQHLCQILSEWPLKVKSHLQKLALVYMIGF